MSSVYLLTLRQLSGRWRLMIMAVLAAMPIVLTESIVLFESRVNIDEFELIVLNTMLAGSITPLVVLAIATVAFGNEVEDRTLANLTLAPIPRWQIVIPKLLAAVSVSAPFIAISALVTSHLAFNADATATVAVTVSTLVGLALYSSLFVFLGLATSQAIGVGLLYIVLWEGFFSNFVSGVRLFSIRSYSIAWMHGLDERRFADTENLGFQATVIVSVVVFVGFVLLTIRQLRHMDVP